jgi:hypothetical protein
VQTGGKAGGFDALQADGQRLLRHALHETGADDVVGHASDPGQVVDDALDAAPLALIRRRGAAAQGWASATSRITPAAAGATAGRGVAGSMVTWAELPTTRS